MKPRSYPKPQTLCDWRKYRLTDLFNFFDVPENERNILRWIMDTENPGFHDDRYKIGNEWCVVFIRFRQSYESMQRRGIFQKSIEELEEIRAREAGR